MRGMPQKRNQRRSGRRTAVTLALSGMTGLGSLVLASSAAGAATKFTGAPVTVMVTGTYTEPNAGISDPEIPAAALALAKVVNKNGGIKDASGKTHKFDVKVCDSQGSASKLLDCTREAISDHVAAVIGYNGSQGDQMTPLLQKARIPLIGAEPNSKTITSSPISFPTVSGGFGAYGGVVASLARVGAKTQSFTVENLGSASVSQQLANFTAKAKSVTLHLPTPVPPTQTDYTPIASAAVANGVKGVGFFIYGNAAGEFVKDVRQTGFTGHISSISGAVNQHLIDSLGSVANGLVVVGDTNFLTSKGGRRYAAEMKAYNRSLPLDDNGAVTWIGTWLFTQVAKKVKVINAANILKVMGTLRNFNMLGMTPPLTTAVKYTGPSPYPAPRLYNPTVITYRVKNGKLVTNGKFYSPFTGKGNDASKSSGKS